MIISRSHANRLVRAGKATKSGTTYHGDEQYQILNRHDLQRVDHYPLPASFPRASQIPAILADQRPARQIAADHGATTQAVKFIKRRLRGNIK